MFQKYKKVILIIWGIFLITPFAYYLYSPSTFSPENISDFIKKFETHILLTYFVISVLRGFTLIPPTVVVLAGSLLSPEKPVSLLIISLFGIIISSSFIYFFSKKFEIDKYFDKRFPEKILYIKKKFQPSKIIPYFFIVKGTRDLYTVYFSHIQKMQRLILNAQILIKL